MVTVEPDTNDEIEFVKYEIDRICKLLNLEKPEIIELKKVKSLSPVPKLSRDGKKIILYNRGFDNYTWQIGQAFNAVLKKGSNLDYEAPNHHISKHGIIMYSNNVCKRVFILIWFYYTTNRGFVDYCFIKLRWIQSVYSV